MLELVREENNQHDASAIALHYNNKKIGYVPRESNEILARLIDAGVIDLHTEITHVNTQAATWENIFIGVYVLKERKGSVSALVAALTLLETPRYRSLKIKLYGFFMKMMTAMPKKKNILEQAIYFMKP